MEVGRHLDRATYSSTAELVDWDTFLLSGGFERNESYQNLKAYGAENIPFLVEDLRSQPKWWKIQMVADLAIEHLDQCIIFPDDIKGYLEPVKDRIINWWESINITH